MNYAQVARIGNIRRAIKNISKGRKTRYNKDSE
jgi:hypothetical protein